MKLAWFSNDMEERKTNEKCPLQSGQKRTSDFADGLSPGSVLPQPLTVCNTKDNRHRPSNSEVFLVSINRLQGNIDILTALGDPLVQQGLPAIATAVAAPGLNGEDIGDV